jgi:hypothetical protein
MLAKARRREFLAMLVVQRDFREQRTHLWQIPARASITRSAWLCEYRAGDQEREAANCNECSE